MYILIHVTYNVFFHPLSKFPGPISYAATPYPFCRDLLSGYRPQIVKSLHDKYGEVVRVAPDELSFNSGQSWKDIYGQYRGEIELPKDKKFYVGGTFAGTESILFASRVAHSRQRRVLSHAFSEKALREQEDFIASYVTLLVQKLDEQVHGPAEGKVDIQKWYNFATFDLIGDLTFGEPFDCLKNEQYHSWVSMLFASTKVIAYLVVIGRVPFLTNLVMRLVPRSLKEQADAHGDLSKQKTLRRMEMKDSNRVDFMTRILKDSDKNDLRTEELFGNTSTLIIAGSETTATFLSGATYFLAKFPAVMEKLVHELHSSFAEEMDINMVDLRRSEYLNAVIEESFRMYPPVAIGMPRRVEDQGASIGGYFVPKNVSLILSPS